MKTRNTAARYHKIDNTAVCEAIAGNVPKNTRRSTRTWATIFQEYAVAVNFAQPDISKMTIAELNDLLSQFVLGVRDTKGEKYAPGSLTTGANAIVRKWNEYQSDEFKVSNLFKDKKLQSAYAVLNSEVRKMQEDHFKLKKQSDILKDEQITQIFNCDLLNETTPRGLLYRTYFALALQVGPRKEFIYELIYDELSFKLDDDMREYIQYKASPDKNNKGGVALLNRESDLIGYIWSNMEDRSRCPVELIKKMISHRPTSSPKFLFLSPLTNPHNDGVWYKKSRFGTNSIGTIVFEVCKFLGFEGKYSNHSLRATVATKLYEEGVDEQAIKEITGHKSDRGVRSYKRTNMEMRKNHAEILMEDRSHKSKKRDLKAKEEETLPSRETSFSASPQEVKIIFNTSSAQLSVQTDTSISQDVREGYKPFAFNVPFKPPRQVVKFPNAPSPSKDNSFFEIEKRMKAAIHRKEQLNKIESMIYELQFEKECLLNTPSGSLHDM